jgi:hypothetical protein
MATYTVEKSWLVPYVVHTTVEARNSREAIVKAMEADDYDNQRACWDGATDTEITGCWKSDQAYSGTAVRVPKKPARGV